MQKMFAIPYAEDKFSLQKLFVIPDAHDKFISPDMMRKMADHNTLVIEALNQPPKATPTAPVKTSTSRPLKKSDLWPAKKQ